MEYREPEIGFGVKKYHFELISRFRRFGSPYSKADPQIIVVRMAPLNERSKSHQKIRVAALRITWLQ